MGIGARFYHVHQLRAWSGCMLSIHARTQISTLASSEKRITVLHGTVYGLPLSSASLSGRYQSPGEIKAVLVGVFRGRVPLCLVSVLLE